MGTDHVKADGQYGSNDDDARLNVESDDPPEEIKELFELE